jgi:hypothetical protein
MQVTPYSSGSEIMNITVAIQMGETSNAYSNLMRKCVGKQPVGKVEQVGG